MAYGVAADCLDECLRIGESATLKSLYHFAEAINAVFGQEYPRSPTREDCERLLAENAQRGWSMIGSIDCYLWQWKNCPKAHHGINKGAKRIELTLEAVASHDLWIWHALFGMFGSLNDINVLQRSTLIQSLINGEFHTIEYEVNGRPSEPTAATVEKTQSTPTVHGSVISFLPRFMTVILVSYDIIPFTISTIIEKVPHFSCL